jgi:hypothetical protein
MRTAIVVTPLVLSLFLACKPASTEAADASAVASASAAASAAPSAAASAAPPTPVNVADVKRYSDETAMNEDGTLAWPATNIRKAPQNGALIAVLKKGTAVTKTAKYKVWFLIAFDDPKSGKRMEGWTFQDSFKASANNTHSCYDNPAGICDEPDLKCPAGLTHFEFEGDYCAKKCTSDSDCSKGMICETDEHTLIVNGKPAGSARHCQASLSGPSAPSASSSASAATPSATASAKKKDPQTCAGNMVMTPSGCAPTCEGPDDKSCPNHKACNGVHVGASSDSPGFMVWACFE